MRKTAVTLPITFPYSCKLCEKICPSMQILGCHLRGHKIKTKDYFFKYVYNEINPLCKCGCGEKTVWRECLHVFSDFVAGHNNDLRFSSTNQPAKNKK